MAPAVVARYAVVTHAAEMCDSFQSKVASVSHCGYVTLLAAVHVGSHA
jgi:hypothetical protein